MGSVKFNYVEMTLAIKKYELDCAWFCPSSKLQKKNINYLTGHAEQTRYALASTKIVRKRRGKNEKKNYGF